MMINSKKKNEAKKGKVRPRGKLKVVVLSSIFSLYLCKHNPPAGQLNLREDAGEKLFQSQTRFAFCELSVEDIAFQNFVHLGVQAAGQHLAAGRGFIQPAAN